MMSILCLLLILPSMIHSKVFIDFSDRKKSSIIKELSNHQISNVNVVISYSQQNSLDSYFVKLVEIGKSQKNSIYVFINLSLLYQDAFANDTKILNKNTKKKLQRLLNEISLQNRLGLVIDMQLIPELWHEPYKRFIKKIIKKVIFVNTSDYKQYNNQEFWDELKNHFSIEKLDSDTVYSFYVEKHGYKDLGLLFLLSLYKKNIFIRGPFFDNEYAVDLVKIVSQPKLKYYTCRMSGTSVLVFTSFNVFGINLSSNVDIVSFQHNIKSAYQRSVVGSMPIWEHPQQMLVFPDSIVVWRLK